MSQSERSRRVSSARLEVDVISEPCTILALKSAMLPETSAGKKCTLELESSSDNRKLTLVFSSNDLVSLRASMNTNLRLVASALKTIRAVSGIESTKP